MAINILLFAFFINSIIIEVSPQRRGIRSYEEIGGKDLVAALL
jgi:hypothetical protein